MKLTLRPYQQEAVDAAWQSLRRGEHPVIQLPTGSGKALVLSELSLRVLNGGGRVLIATHVSELVAQNAAEYQSLSGIEPGILCAGLERTDKNHDVLFASVQSLYRPAQRGEIEPFNLIIVDEAHLCAERDSDAKFYPTAFACFPDASRLGLSATPYRMDGPIYGDGKYFTNLCYEADVLRLVQEGYLAPLVGVNAALTLDTSKFKIQAGDFATSSIEEAETDAWLLAVAHNVKELAASRKHIAVFCPSVKVAARASEIFTSVGLASSHVVGDTEDRTGRLDAWKAGEFPVMCSVNVLSTGFNFKALDCIVCLRPTTSTGLWVQILGRGTRIDDASGKKNCLVIDYSGNLALHGGICAGMGEAWDEGKDGAISAAGVLPRVKKRKGKGDGSGRETRLVDELVAIDPMLASPGGLRCEVVGVNYIAIGSKAQPGKRLLMVNYDCRTEGGALVTASEFVCCEYDGWARQKAVEWFERRGGHAPFSADKAQVICWGLPTPREVSIRKNGKYFNVVREWF